MQVCWEADPLDRPSFKDITILLEGMLQDGADYLDLSPRVVHNSGYVSTFAHPLRPLGNSDTGNYIHLYQFQKLKTDNFVICIANGSNNFLFLLTINKLKLFTMY